MKTPDWMSDAMAQQLYNLRHMGLWTWLRTEWRNVTLAWVEWRAKHRRQ